MPSCVIVSSVPQATAASEMRYLHLARHGGIVELVRVPDPLVRRELDVPAAESVAAARAEIRK